MNMKIGILQCNLTIGDVEGNTQTIIDGYQNLCDQGADIVVGSELMIFGYPPKDILERKHYIDKQLECLHAIVDHVSDIPLLVGVARYNKHTGGKPLFNSLAYISAGTIVYTDKFLLPTYDVFDERRYFEPKQERDGTPSTRPLIVSYQRQKIAILICEDIWSELPDHRNSTGSLLYHQVNPVEQLVGANIDMLLVVNASPYNWGKADIRRNLVCDIAKKIDAPVVYVNQVGGNDDLVFDGRSLVVDKDGGCLFEGRAFAEDLSVVSLAQKKRIPFHTDTGNLLDLYEAIVLGTRDYAHKTGHTKGVVGLSGGLDSAIVFAIGVRALGAKNMHGLIMPSTFSSQESIDDAIALAQGLGASYDVIPISDVYDTFGCLLDPHIGWTTPGTIEGDVTEENIQARIRGMIIMAYANRRGYLPLTTGNKSETAVGYCTLYGDTAGGFAPICDIPKSTLYDLACFINNDGVIIPINTIEKPPSAELSPDQKDEDSLPPYDVLDGILAAYIENGVSPSALVETGYDPATVKKVIDLIHRNEFKRNQMPPGLRLTGKAFGTGRRMPIVAKYPRT